MAQDEKNNSFREYVGAAVLGRQERLHSRQNIDPCELHERNLLDLIIESVGEIGDYDGPPHGDLHPFSAALSAAPAQPAAVEGAGEPVAWQIEDREEGWIDFNPTNDAQKNPATWAKLGWNVRPLYAHPSPTPAADVVRSQPDDPTEEMIQAALEVDFDNEDERGAVINLWHVMKAAAPPADDALRVAAIVAKNMADNASYNINQAGVTQENATYDRAFVEIYNVLDRALQPGGER